MLNEVVDEYTLTNFEAIEDEARLEDGLEAEALAYRNAWFSLFCIYIYHIIILTIACFYHSFGHHYCIPGFNKSWYSALISSVWVDLNLY